MQGYRTRHGVDHRLPGTSRFQEIRLQPEIPLRRPVRVIDQHQPWIVFQPLGLQDHRLLVLPQKLLRKDTKDRHWQEQIPSRREINPAKIAAHRRHRRPARKPQLPAPDLLRPDIGQHKVDRRCHRLAGIFLQHPIRRAVRAWRMRAHPESVRNWLELLFFFVDAVPAPPVPRLMHKWPVRRVHQSDDALIDVRGQLAIEMRNPVFLGENSQIRRGRNLFRQSRSGTIHVNPEISVALFARIMPRKNALHFQFVLASQRWNFHALPAACFKSPSVIAALERFPVESSIRKWNAPVRTRITHRKRRTLGSPPQHERHLEQHRRCQPLAGNFRAPQSRIPKIPQKTTIGFAGGCPSRFAVYLQQVSYCFAHGRGCIVVQRVAPGQPPAAAASEQLREASNCAFPSSALFLYVSISMYAAFY